MAVKSEVAIMIHERLKDLIYSGRDLGQIAEAVGLEKSDMLRRYADDEERVSPDQAIQLGLALGENYIHYAAYSRATGPEF